MPVKKKPQMNENQLKTIRHKTGPLLVVAGAGTGKTKVITERIKDLIQNRNVKPNKILALTFTEKAASEMLNRLGDVMPLGYEEPWVYTFHSFTDRILRLEGLEIGIDPGFKILSASEQWLLLRKNLFNLDLKYFRPLGNPTKFLSAILKFISRLQDEYILPEDFEKFVLSQTYENLDEELKYKELSHVYTKYTQIKVAQSKMDFGDLIIWSLELFKKRSNVLKKYRKQFKHVLIDEFQDTNYAQYELIKLLCPSEMEEQSLVAVGDDSQSIYKFRGAAVSNILQFMEDYPKAEIVTLLQNYRSSQKILDSAYQLIQNNNPDTLESKLGISKELISEVDKNGVSPEIVQLQTLEDEVDFVSKKILELLAKEPHYTFKDISVLARANNHLDPFVLSFRKYGIPYQLVGNRGLYDRDEIRDIISLLNVLTNPKDSISLYRVLNIKTLEIPYQEIAAMLSDSRYKKQDLWEGVLSSENPNVISLKENLQEFHSQMTKATPVEIVYNLVESINYVSQYLEEDSVENQLCVKNLDLFLNIIKRFEIQFHEDNRAFPTLVDFLDYLELIIEAGDNPAQSEIEDIDTVNLMTVHASKGLEFGAVFMVNLVSDRFPTRNKSDTIEIPNELVKETLPTGDEHIQEERRLFYVGMTRAEKYLYITLAKNYGGKREKTPSGYLNETGLKTHQITEAELKESKQENTLFGVDSEYRKSNQLNIQEYLPDFLSYTQLETYKDCPLKYKYSYILKIPTPPNHALSFGITIHECLKEFHFKKTFDDNITLDQVMDIYSNKWQPLGYLDEEHRNLRFEEGKKLLEKYYEKHKVEKLKHLALEKSFNLKLAGVKFFGKIDRIDELSNGNVEIIDYKTGSPKTQKEVDNDMQITIYAIAAKEALGLNPTLLSFYFFETGEKLSTTRTSERLEKQKEEIAEIVTELKKGKFDATPGMHCNWCDYKNICPYAYKG